MLQQIISSKGSLSKHWHVNICTELEQFGLARQGMRDDLLCKSCAVNAETC